MTSYEQELKMVDELEKLFWKENPMTIEDEFSDKFDYWIDKKAEEFKTEGIEELYKALIK